MMWPFTCKNCKAKEADLELKEYLIAEGASIIKNLRELSKLEWTPYTTYMKAPPLNTNLLVANKDFTYFGFLYMEDGWDYSRKINMHGKDKIWPTYTNPESIHWWLNLDEIKK